MKTLIKQTAGRVLSNFPRAQDKVKKWNELLFWKMHLRKTEGRFHNGHYEVLFTRLFGIDKAHYAGKRILDVGCGPLGSLEWADAAAERVGVDVLANEYLVLNKGRHRMRYVAAGSEEMPFEDGHFDTVSMFNALDHVSSIERTVTELVRVLKPGGDLLILVEIGHPPTITEPHRIDETIVDAFPGCDVVSRAVFMLGPDHNVFTGALNGTLRANPREPGVLCIRLRKR